jgi:hypothetical protein
MKRLERDARRSRAYRRRWHALRDRRGPAAESCGKNGWVELQHGSSRWPRGALDRQVVPTAAPRAPPSVRCACQAQQPRPRRCVRAARAAMRAIAGARCVPVTTPAARGGSTARVAPPARVSPRRAGEAAGSRASPLFARAKGDGARVKRTRKKSSGTADAPPADAPEAAPEAASPAPEEPVVAAPTHAAAAAFSGAEPAAELGVSFHGAGGEVRAEPRAHLRASDPLAAGLVPRVGAAGV